MSVLTRENILDRIKNNGLSFSPSLDEFQVQTHSVDLRLGFTFLIPKSWEMTDSGRISINIDYLGKVEKKYFDVIQLEAGQYFEVLPREFVVVQTLEKIKIPNDLMAILYPRSSINRRGLSIDLSGIIDAGYEGNLIVPIRNNTSTQVIRIYPGERFCQIVFHSLERKVKPTKSRYSGKDILIGVLKEKSHQEVKLIRNGKIKELKEKFAVK